MKKTISILIVSLVLLTGLFASYHTTTADFTLSLNDGISYGVSSDTFGTFGDKNIGYYGGIDVTIKSGAWKAALLVGPSYRFAINRTNIGINIAGGVGADVSGSGFNLGLGVYAGADWRLTDRFGINIGATVTNNFVRFAFDGSGFGLASKFSISPRVGVGIYY